MRISFYIHIFNKKLKYIFKKIRENRANIGLTRKTEPDDSQPDPDRPDDSEPDCQPLLYNLIISVTSRKLLFSDEAYCGDWLISLVIHLNHCDKKISLADRNGSFDSKFGTKINFSQISNVFLVELFRLRENPLKSRN